MTNYASLLEKDPPWLHALPDRAEGEIVEAAAENRDVLVRVVDGESVQDVDSLFSVMAREFNFPDYFGENWPAFNECIRSLSWLPARAYLLVFQNSEFLLKDSQPDRAVFMKVMRDAGRRWANSFALGDAWGGGDVPFNVVFLCPDGELASTEAQFLG